MAAALPTQTPGLDPEITYDVVLDHADLLLALDNRPRGLNELAARLGEPLEEVAERLAELMGVGLVAEAAGGYKAKAGVFELTCQEALLDFLRDQVLPAVGPALAESSSADALLRDVEGTLDAGGLGALEQGPLAKFWKALETLESAQRSTRRARVTFVLCGSTTTPPSEVVGAGPRALWRLEQASKERAAERAGRATDARALLYHVRLSLEASVWPRALCAVDELLAALRRSGGPGRAFGLTVAGLREAPAAVR